MSKKREKRTHDWLAALATMALALTAMTMATGAWSQGFEKQVDSISTALAEQIAQAGKKSVAVIDFSDLQGSVTELGKFLAEEFSAALAGSGKGFAVVDRNNLSLILKEQKLAATGLLDPTTVLKLGQIAGVDALVTGTLTPFGDTVRVSLKILDTATAKVIGAARGDIPKTKAVEELLARGVAPASTAPPGSPSSPERKPGGQSIAVKGFVITVEACKAGVGKLTCTGTVVSESYAGQIVFWGGRFIDPRGNEYRCDEITFGSGRRSSDRWGGSVTNSLVPGVPMRWSIAFTEFPTGLSELTMLELYWKDVDEFSAVFRKIPVSQ